MPCSIGSGIAVIRWVFPYTYRIEWICLVQWEVSPYNRSGVITDTVVLWMQHFFLNNWESVWWRAPFSFRLKDCTRTQLDRHEQYDDEREYMHESNAGIVNLFLCSVSVYVWSWLRISPICWAWLDVCSYTVLVYIVLFSACSSNPVVGRIFPLFPFC